MPRRSRRDEPGSLHHVFNRGVARRSAFEGRDDIRFFQACLARVCRAGLLEVHAFAFLLTHFHLLVRSPRGELSRAIGWVENQYVRWFNRRRGRDGPLFRGRFGSERVDSNTYLLTLIRYIDQNPVAAGMAREPAQYPFGSAIHYARSRRPLWLTRTLVESIVMDGSGRDTYDPARYSRSLGRLITPAEHEVVSRRMRGDFLSVHDLDDLLGAAPEEVREHLRRKMLLADGTRPGLPLVTDQTVTAIVRAREQEEPRWIPASPGMRKTGWSVLLTGLWREVCGLTFGEIAARTGRSHVSARRDFLLHRKLIEEVADYADRAAGVLAEAVAAVYPDGGGSGETKVTNYSRLRM